MIAKDKNTQDILAAILAGLESDPREECEERLPDPLGDKDSEVPDMLASFSQYDSHADWRRVAFRLHSHAGIRPRRMAMARYAAVAAVAICAGLGLWQLPGSKTHVAPTLEVFASILPAQSKALLELDNGVVIDLAMNGRAVALPGIEDNSDGKLVYRHQHQDEAPRRHKLKVPRGGEYRIVLPDNTLVVMSSESELIYPSCFTDSVRRVELVGEAYFDVSRDPHKRFVVSTATGDVVVHGTCFNVKAYPGEDMRTTLIEGSVSIVKGKDNIVMTPGQQLIVYHDEQNTLTVRQVDLQSIVSGQDKRFVFENEPLEDVMRMLERWYDVKIVIMDRRLSEVHFTGNLPKYQDLSKVLHMLELTSRLTFSLNGNTVIVNKDMR